MSDEELGMFWRDTELSWWWYRSPIETQALMIEALDEVMDDAHAVEDCKVWLLKQKQTQDWKTTKATADAVYALLLRGAGQLASDELVEVSLGRTRRSSPEKVEAGTGFYEQRFVRGEITPDMGRITVKKVDPGVAWGSVHWQYLEDMSKVTPYEGTPLRLEKSLYTRQYTSKGPVLEPVRGPLAVGDELVVRIVLRTDRDMEYVHLKDQRAAARSRSPSCRSTSIRTAWPTTRRRATRPAISSSTTCPRASTCSSTRRASSTRASTRREWPRSSACTPRSSTATPRVSGWR